MEMLEADRLQGGFNSVVYSTFKCFLSIILSICLPLPVKKILLETPRSTCIFVNTLRAHHKGEGSCSSTHEEKKMSFILNARSLGLMSTPELVTMAKIMPYTYLLISSLSIIVVKGMYHSE